MARAVLWACHCNHSARVTSARVRLSYRSWYVGRTLTVLCYLFRGRGSCLLFQSQPLVSAILQATRQIRSGRLDQPTWRTGHLDGPSSSYLDTDEYSLLAIMERQICLISPIDKCCHRRPWCAAGKSILSLSSFSVPGILRRAE